MTSARGVTNLIFGASLPILVLDIESVYLVDAIIGGEKRLVTPAKKEARK
jgi:hypothetical protein